MAIQPRYADLSSYRRNVDRAQGTANVLDSLLSGVNQGIKLQQLPQQMQDQELARQLQNAINTQKLFDLQNPEQALARRLQQELTLKAALNPELGIRRSEPGLEGVTIANPSAITMEQQATLPSNETIALRENALAQAGIPIPETIIPRAAPMAPETPISAFGINTGLTSNPNIVNQAQEDKLNDQIRLANSRLRSSSAYPQGQFMVDPETQTMVFVQKPMSFGGQPTSVPVTAPSGEPLKAPVKTSSIRALTEGQRTSLLTRAGKSGVDPSAFVKEDGSYNYDQLAIASGKAEREASETARKAKLEAIPAELRTKAAGYLAVQKDLDNLKGLVQDLQVSGGVPSLLDNAIASATSAPPTGFFSNLYRAGLQSFQSADSKEFEGTKARVSSSLTNMISGAAVPDSERKFLTPFLPFPGESLKSIVGKIAGLEDYLNNRITSFNQTPTNSPTSQNTGATRVVPGVGTIRIKK